MTLFATRLSVLDQLEPISQIGNECAKRWRPAGSTTKAAAKIKSPATHSFPIYEVVPAKKEIP